MTRTIARTMTRAAAYNNPPQPGTHFPRKTAPHRPSFLIQCPELETDLTCTKQQTADDISNRQFLAFLKLPDTFPPGSFRDDHFPRPAPRKTQQTARNRRSLIGNDKHSRASATALKCAISIFLIGNEFHLWRASKKNPHARKSSMWHPADKRKSRSLTPIRENRDWVRDDTESWLRWQLWKRRGAQVKGAERGDGTLVAAGMRELAGLRGVPLDQQVRADLRLASFRERVAQNVLHQAVGSIPLRARQVGFAAKQAQRNVNAIRRDSGDGRGLAEEQNLFRGGVGDRWEFLQRPFRVAKWTLHHSAHVAAEFFEDARGDIAKALRAQFWHHAAGAGRVAKSFVGCGKNFFRREADLLFERLKTLVATLVGLRVARVAMQNHLVGIGGIRTLRRAVMFFEAVENLHHALGESSRGTKPQGCGLFEGFGHQMGEILAQLLTRRGVCASKPGVKAGLKVYAKIVTLVFPRPLQSDSQSSKKSARRDNRAADNFICWFMSQFAEPRKVDDEGVRIVFRAAADVDSGKRTTASEGFEARHDRGIHGWIRAHAVQQCERLSEHERILRKRGRQHSAVAATAGRRQRAIRLRDGREHAYLWQSLWPARFLPPLPFHIVHHVWGIPGGRLAAGFERHQSGRPEIFGERILVQSGRRPGLSHLAALVGARV